MSKRIVGLLLICGVLLGASLVLCTGISNKATEGSKKDWSRLRIVTYASGLTGFFDPDTGRLFVYDSNMENCFIIRELTELGEPMKKLKN